MVIDAFDSEDRPNFTYYLDKEDVEKFVMEQIKKPENAELGLSNSTVAKIVKYRSEFDGVWALLDNPDASFNDVIKITNFDASVLVTRQVLNQEDFIKFMYNALKKSGKQDEWKDVYVGQTAFNYYSCIGDFAPELRKFTKKMPLDMFPRDCDSRIVVEKLAAATKSKKIKDRFNYDVEAYVNSVLGLPAPEDAPGGDE